MIGIFGSSANAVALASALALKEEEVLLYTSDDSDLDELKDREVSAFSKTLDTFFKKAKESGKLSFSTNLQALLACDLIFISGTIVRGETDPNEAMRLFIPNVLTLLRRAGAQRKPAQELNIVILDELPYGGYKALLGSIQKEEIEPGESYLEDDTVTNEQINHLTEKTEKNPEGLNFHLALSPLIFDEEGLKGWIKRARQAVIGSYSEELIGRLKEVYKKIGVPRREVFISAPQGVEDALILKDAYKIVQQVFVNEAAKVSDDDLFFNLIKTVKAPQPSFQIDNTMVERLEGLTAVKKDLTFFQDALKDALAAKQERSDRIVDELSSYYNGSLEDVVIAAAGFYLKPEDSDMRGSLFIDLATKLAQKGAQLHLFTPDGGRNLKWRLNSSKDNITYFKKLSDCVKGASAFLYLGKAGVPIDLKRLAASMKEEPVLFDPFGLLASRKGIENFILL